MTKTFAIGDQVGIRTIPAAVGTIQQPPITDGHTGIYLVAYTTDWGITEKLDYYTEDQFTGTPAQQARIFADGQAEYLDQLATNTARYIASDLKTAQTKTLTLPGVSVFYANDRRPPATVEGIKLALLDGRIWISWMDDRVTAAMRELHGEPTGDAADLAQD